MFLVHAFVLQVQTYSSKKSVSLGIVPTQFLKNNVFLKLLNLMQLITSPLLFHRCYINDISAETSHVQALLSLIPVQIQQENYFTNIIY